MKKLNIVQRAGAPTPKFFKTLRTAGIVMAAVGGAILTAPVSIPLVIVNIAGYLTVAGGVLTAVSQITVDESKINLNKDEL